MRPSCRLLARPRPLSPTWFLIAAVVVAAGCGSKANRTPTYPTTGTILRDGQPVAGALVRFHPVGSDRNALPLTTRTERDGHYSLSTNYADDGAATGDYIVSVLTDLPPDNEGGDPTPRPLPRTRRAATASGDQTADPATSPLRATIAPGSNQFDFEIR